MHNLRFFTIIFFVWLPTSTLAITFAQSPLFISTTEPRIMLVSSRDHQLTLKAYTDYSDIDANGSLDTTYKDSFSYYGYYDPNKCYTYSTTNSRFEPTTAVSTGTHQCNGSTWSGNFMNWATMTRMDVLRKTFYGGYRSTDSLTETVLERHFITDDVHAFSKVYNPANNATLKLYIPSTVVGTNTAISLCNVTDTTSTTLTGQMTFPLATPLIKVAGGAWPQWDSSELNECQIGLTTQPATLLGTYNARIKVCDSTVGLESNCKIYTNPTTGVQIPKPTGLLQQYGDVDAPRRVRFGLMTGSYAANKSGGTLRKNISFLTNNNNTSVLSGTICGNNNANDEIDVCTGQFINQASTQAGIINTLNRLHIAGFKYTSSGGNGSHQYNCNSPGILTFSNGQCVDWGNPISEIYLEALRYFSNAGPTTAFDVSDASILSSIPKVSWTDPLPSAEWCAVSNIVVLSTGINSFDTDELTAFTPSGGSAIDANALTQTVGDASHESINGSSLLIGSNGPTNNNQCTAKTVTNLALAKGVCPEAPSIEGGYGIAGLSYAPKTIDLRPGYSALRTARWGGTSPINADWALRQPLDTYTVQLGEALPSFKIAVGSGAITLLPACQANSNSSPGAWTSSSTGWRNCSMTNLVVENNVAAASVGTDVTTKTNTCSGSTTDASSRCFRVSWEDSTWGNDYDMDGIQRLGYCVGSSCSTFKMVCPTTTSANATIGPFTATASQMIIATCVIQTQAGHALTFGYTVSGSTSDGPSFPILRPGGLNFLVGGVLPSGVSSPSNVTFSTGSVASALLLKDPLWYAAKYGGFTDTTPTIGTPRPDLVSEWDVRNNFTGVGGADGDPDNYFNVRNPANLITALGNVFDRAAQRSGDAASAATNSTSLQINSRIFQAKFSPIDWSGQLISYKLNLVNNVFSLVQEWDAGQIINTQSTRTILTKGASDGVAFNYGSLTGPTATAGTQQNLLDKNASGLTDNCGVDRVAYLRGSAANEDAANVKFNCTSPSTSNITKFRQRNTSKLGDIVDSNPLYVGPPNAGYSDVEHPGYSAFSLSNANRKPIVYVGANDGMLHGFDSSLSFPAGNVPGIPSATAGQEVLAYIPSAVYPNLSKLTDQTYNKNHLYFVNNSAMGADVDLDSSSANNWRTVLISGMGGGGKGYFALDVTDPNSFSESGSAPDKTLLWEFNETDMGFVVNLPATDAQGLNKQIVKMANGKWAVILGNGYNSVAGKAVLYVLFIENGVDGTWDAGDFVKIVVDAPVSPATNANNGLSTPIPFDSNGDGFADVVYVGDLKGNLWKFLVGPNTSDASVTTTPASWKVAFSGAPLFVAKSATGTIEPIVSPPEVTFNPNGGQIVFIGTGKYLELTDINDTSQQTFYAIWDKNDGVTKVGDRTVDLLQQTASVPSASPNFRVFSTNIINWRTGAVGGVNPANCTPVSTCNPSHMGWYFDLPTTKERIVGIPKFLNDLIFFNSLIPSDAPCDAGGSGWLMALDYLSGGNVSSPVFDANGDGVINSADLLAAGFKVGASIGGSIIIQNDTSFGIPDSGSPGVSTSSTNPPSVIVTCLTTGTCRTDQTPPPVKKLGRMNWREIY